MPYDGLVMADAIHSIQKLLQELIAPDVRETKVRLEALEKRMDAEFQSLRKENESMRKENESFRNEMRSETGAIRTEMDANFRALMSSIAELKANNEILSLREIASLRERVAVLEAHRAPQ